MADNKCPYCGVIDCDDDCGERAMIYREHQRNQLRDIDLDELETEDDDYA